MKHSLLFILTILIFSSCSKSKVEYHPDKPCVIYGQIYNLQIYPNVKTITLKLNQFAGEFEEFTAEIDSSGNFRFDFYPKLKREVELTSIEDIIVVAPGDSVYVEKDFESVGKTIFKGDHILLNANISRFRKYYLGNYILDDRMGVNEFEKFCTQQKTQFYTKLETYRRRYKTDEEFENWAHLTIELDYYKALVDQAAERQQASMNNLFIAFTNYYKVNALKRKINNLMDESYLLNNYFYMSHSFTMHKIMRYQIRQMLTAKQMKYNFPMDYMIDNMDDSFLGQMEILNIIHLAKQWDQVELSTEQKNKIEKVVVHPYLKEAI